MVVVVEVVVAVGIRGSALESGERTIDTVSVAVDRFRGGEAEYACEGLAPTAADATMDAVIPMKDDLERHVRVALSGTRLVVAPSSLSLSRVSSGLLPSTRWCSAQESDPSAALRQNSLGEMW